MAVMLFGARIEQGNLALLDIYFLSQHKEV